MKRRKRNSALLSPKIVEIDLLVNRLLCCVMLCDGMVRVRVVSTAPRAAPPTMRDVFAADHLPAADHQGRLSEDGSCPASPSAPRGSTGRPLSPKRGNRGPKWRAGERTACRPETCQGKGFCPPAAKRPPPETHAPPPSETHACVSGDRQGALENPWIFSNAPRNARVRSFAFPTPLEMQNPSQF